MNVTIVPVKAKAVWPLFAPHHYLTGKYAGHRAFLAVLADTGDPVAFTSSISFPHAKVKHGRREHRTVVLPDFQGLGLGVRLSEWLGEWHIRQGHRFYSRTTHPRMSAYREASPLWRATGGSGKRQTPSKMTKESGSGVGGAFNSDTTRIAFSHEYIGHRATMSA